MSDFSEQRDINLSVQSLSTGAPVSSTDIFGHPRGLVTLAGTELWERISFHGMVALLTLYMADQLLLPGQIEKIVGFAGYRRLLESITGPLTVEALATQTFGIYIGLIYFTPVLGGLIGDRWLGRRNAVIVGCVLMMLGHFCMAFDQSFLFALLLLILGAGFLRGNLIAQVGGLYKTGDARSTHAMQIYYSMVNLGGFIAPLITGALGQSYGWHYGFGFAGFGMLLGLIIYVVGARNLPQDMPRRVTAHHSRLNFAERRSIFALLLLMPLLTMYWVVNSQEWNAYNLWVRDHIDLGLFGWQIPVPWVQSLASIDCVVLVPVVLLLWRSLAAIGREPDEIGKLTLGCLIMGTFTACDGCSTLLFGSPHQVPLLWIVITNLGLSFGYLHVQPVAIALFARTSPVALKAMMVGVYFLSIFFGGLISGRLGALYGQWSAANFWLLHAGIVCTAGLLFPVFGRSVRVLREARIASA
jgi:POT family proton-dependent oligopeptide transporter